MKKFLHILALLAFLLLSQCGVAFAVSGEPSVLLRFSDETRFYRVPSADVLSTLMMEKLAASGKFVLRSERPIDAGKEHPAVDGSQTKMPPESLKTIGASYGAKYAVSGSIEKLGAVHTVYRDLGNAASAAGQIADIFTGGLAGAILGAFGGASTAKDTLGVVVNVCVLDLSDGRTIWEKDFSAVETIPNRDDPNTDVVDVGGISANRTLAKAMDTVADAAVKALIEDVGQNRLLIK